MDEQAIREMIAGAFERASQIKVECILTTPPKRSMSSEDVQSLYLTKDSLIDAFLQDQRVDSATCTEGEFRILTKEGYEVQFRMVFEDEQNIDSSIVKYLANQDRDEVAIDMLAVMGWDLADLDILDLLPSAWLKSELVWIYNNMAKVTETEYMGKTDIIISCEKNMVFTMRIGFYA